MATVTEQLSRLEARLEGVEVALTRIVDALDQAKPALTMAADLVASEWVTTKLDGDAPLEGAMPGGGDVFDSDPLEQRVAAIEQVVEKMAAAPAVADPRFERVAELAASLDDNVAMAGDIFDEWVRDNVGGEAMEERFQHGTDALIRLTEPQVIDALTRLAERAPKLEKLADLAASFDDNVAMAGDIADEWVRDNIGGDAMEQRFTAGTQALVALSEPQVLEALTRLAAQAPRLESVAGLAASFDDNVAMAGDIFDEWVRNGIGGDGLEELVSSLQALLDPETFSAYVDIIGLAPNLMRTARVAADLDEFVEGMAQALHEPAPPVGFWGLLTALSDADVQRGVGRALQLTRHLGKNENLLPVKR